MDSKPKQKKSFSHSLYYKEMLDHARLTLKRVSAFIVFIRSGLQIIDAFWYTTCKRKQELAETFITHTEDKIIGTSEREKKRNRIYSRVR